MTGKIAVGGITKTSGLVMVKILGARSGQGLAGRALSGLGLKGINISCVTSFTDREGLNNLAFAISDPDLDQTLGILQAMQDELEIGKIDYQRRCTAISIYGPHFSERPAIAGTVFRAVGEACVPIHLIATSFSTVTFLTDSDQADRAEDQLREHFLVP
jgi:aspartokinase